MDENRVKHLEMIQAVITRQAGNSFSVKGWSLLIVTALFALSAKDSDQNYAVLAILPGVCFWALDAFYLRQERLFRSLYNHVRSSKEAVDFSMDTSGVGVPVRNWFCTLFARVVFPFHFAIVGAAIAAWLIFRQSEHS